MNLRLISYIVAISGLAFILIITILYASGSTQFDNYLNLLLAGTFLWFAGILLAKRVGQK